MCELKTKLYEAIFEIIIEHIEQKHGVMDDATFNDHSKLFFECKENINFINGLVEKHLQK